MMPAAPPLPVPRNLPFHAAVGGSHTSILMCDSGVGVSVAATRQNSGVFIGVPLALAPGARNVPASTVDSRGDRGVLQLERAERLAGAGLLGRGRTREAQHDRKRQRDVQREGFSRAPHHGCPPVLVVFAAGAAAGCATQLKFAASSVLPVPFQRATCG